MPRNLESIVKAFKKKADFRSRFSLAKKIVELTRHETINIFADAMVDESKYWKDHYGTGIKHMFTYKYSELVGKKFSKKKTYRNIYGAIETDGGFFAALEDYEIQFGNGKANDDIES